MFNTLICAISVGGIVGIAIAVILVVLIIGMFIGNYNKLVKSKIKVEESESGIDVALTKRYDMLTKQLDVVKGYAKHEETVLIEVIKMRGGMTVEEKAQYADQLTAAQNKINLVAEAYPELKSAENFKTLQYAIADVEEHLQAARRAYNANVSFYNKLIMAFPSNIFAKMFKFEKAAFFEATETQRQDVKMDFGF